MENKFNEFDRTMRLGNYDFILGKIKGGNAAAPYYITIRNKNGDFHTDTIFSYRFQNEAEAAAFCQDVADNKITVNQIIEKNQESHVEIRNQINKEASLEFESFLHDAQRLGIDISKLPQFLKSYDNLMDATRSYLRSDKKIEDFLHSNPPPAQENKEMTFGEWLDITGINVNVCLVDKDAEEHFLSSVSYIDPEGHA